MRASELQIGDWALYMGRPFKVVSIEENEFVKVGDGERVMSTYGKHLSPVPLMPEFFEKNGIADSTDKIAGSIMPEAFRHWRHETRDEVIRVFQREEGDTSYALSLSNPDEDMSLILVSCSHVHEFQHALRLSGIEREVTL